MGADNKSEVCSADEVALVNALYRAGSGAGATAGTLRVVNLGEIVYYVNSVVRAGLLTLAAGNTAVDAGTANLGTL